jgi:hypothetical protein
MTKTLKSAGSTLLLFFFSNLPVDSENLTFQLIYKIEGQAPYDHLGSVAGIGDVDNDGTPDFLVGATGVDTGTIEDVGAAYLYSGASGNLLFTVNGVAPRDFLGSVAGTGDVNGDGVPDFMIGAHRADSGGVTDVGSVFVYSGIDRSLLYQKYGTERFTGFGGILASAGDVNGDGKSDFILGAPDAFNLDQGAVYIYSGADGNLLYQINGTPLIRGLGIDADSIGDINGDGKTDIIIGAYFATPDTFLQAGSAFLYSGADTSLIYRVDGTANDQYLGISVAGTGDVNGDGTPDFIAGAYLANPGGLNSTGAAYVYSGVNGSLLHEINGSVPNEWFGHSVTGIEDIDGDGRNDFVIGAPHYNPFIPATTPGKVYVYSGATSTLLGEIGGTDLYDGFGLSIADVGDLNGDGKHDLIIGSPGADTGRGAAYVYSLVATDVTENKGNRPGRYELSQNYPNPFNPTTTIRYYLPKREKVTLEVFNLLGKHVKTLANEEQTAGEHMVTWGGKDKSGENLSSGIYFYRLKGRNFSETKKMLLLK